jgi:hypothetical protein
MSKNKAQTNENSVNVALQELMGMEDDRQSREEKARMAREEEERKRREEDERRRREEEERRRKEEEQARLAAERAQREAEELKRREEEERKLKIKLDAEALARAKEQEQKLKYDLEVKRIEAETKGIPKWIYGVIAGGLVAAVVVVFALYRSHEANLEKQRQAAAEEKARIEQEFREREKVLQAEIDDAKNEERKAQQSLAEAKQSGDTAAYQRALANLEQAKEKTARATHKRRASPSDESGSEKAEKAEKAEKKKKGSGLTDDPFGGGDLGL